MKPTKFANIGNIEYIWDGERWVDAKTYMVPPASVIHRLNDLLSDELEAEDNSISNINELMDRAKKARDALQWRRSHNLLNRIFTIRPDYLPALAVLCSLFRKQGRANEAVEKTESYKSSDYGPLMTSRAAALCDIGKWKEAKIQLFMMQSFHLSEEAKLVFKRIKAARPDIARENIS